MPRENDRPQQFNLTAPAAEPPPAPHFPNRRTAGIPLAKCLILKGRKSLNSNKITLYQAARTLLHGRQFALPGLRFIGGLITR